MITRVTTYWKPRPPARRLNSGPDCRRVIAGYDLIRWAKCTPTATPGCREPKRANQTGESFIREITSAEKAVKELLGLLTAEPVKPMESK